MGRWRITPLHALCAVGSVMLVVFGVEAGEAGGGVLNECGWLVGWLLGWWVFTRSARTRGRYEVKKTPWGFKGGYYTKGQGANLP